MRNVTFWKNNSPNDPIKCESWFPGYKFGYHWLCRQYQSALKELNLDARIVIYEDPIAVIDQYVSSIQEPNIILLQQDHLHYTQLGSLYPVSENILNLVDLANTHPNKNFLFHCFTGRIDKELSQVILPKNLIVASSEVWCFWWALTLYKYGTKITTKLPAEKKFICLNNLNRPHRPALVAYLLAKGLDQYGIISCLRWSDEPNADTFLSSCQDSYIAATVKQGLEKYASSKFVNIPYTNQGILHNYNQMLAKLYESSIVEIVSETTFFETSRYVTDKYIHSVLGANFPIVLGVEGTVKLLNDFGFDLFDDVVDHKYDSISDPATRLSTAIESNIDLLTDPHVDLLWVKHQQRFLNNQQYMFTELLDRVSTIIERDCQRNIQQLVELN